MVNNKNVSAFRGEPPADGRACKIRSGPLYSPSDVLAILELNPPTLWTRRCVGDVASLGFDIEGVRSLLREALIQNRYHNSEWCQNCLDGPWAACDSYLLRRLEWNDNAHKELTCEYYLKFAIARTGQLILTVSCHTSS